jgi:hypothetical protein
LGVDKPEGLSVQSSTKSFARPAQSLNSCGYLSLGFGGASAAGGLYVQIPTPAALDPHEPASNVCVDGQIMNTLLQGYQLEQHYPH